jgi:hypothetical protein
MSQTDHSWKMTVIHDGPGPDFIRTMNEYWGWPKIEYFCTENRYNDYGHSLRKIGVNYLRESKYTLFTNCDNYYIPTFIEEMCNDYGDIVYCDMIHSHWNYKWRGTELRRGALDCGCYIVKTELVKRIGWNHTNYTADWLFIQDCMKEASSIRKVDKILFCHN